MRALVLGLTLAFAPLAHASPASHEAAVRNFFKVAKMDELMNATLVQLTDVQVNANPAMAPFKGVLLQFFTKYMSWKSLEPDLVKLYVKEFSEAEIGEITKFYQTPTGMKVMKKLPELSAQGAAIGQARVQEHIGELQEMIAAEDKKNAPAAAAQPAIGGGGGIGDGSGSAAKP